MASISEAYSDDINPSLLEPPVNPLRLYYMKVVECQCLSGEPNRFVTASTPAEAFQLWRHTTDRTASYDWWESLEDGIVEIYEVPVMSNTAETHDKVEPVGLFRIRSARPYEED